MSAHLVELLDRCGKRIAKKYRDGLSLTPYERRVLLRSMMMIDWSRY